MSLRREKLGAAAKELADHLQLIEHVRSLQAGQKDLADAIAGLGVRLHQMEADVRVLKAEVKLDALREAQAVVYAVQGGLNQQIQDLAVKIAVQQTHRSPGSLLSPADSDPSS